MTNIEIGRETLVVHVQGFDRLWAFTSKLRIPLHHVSGAARATDEISKKSLSIRAPGTHIPGLITAGTFYTTHGRVFWDVHNVKRALAIELHDDRFAKLIIEVEDPAAEISRINAAVAMCQTSARVNVD